MSDKDLKKLIKSHYVIPNNKHMIQLDKIVIEPKDEVVHKKIFNVKQFSLKFASYILVALILTSSYIGVSMLFNPNQVIPPDVNRAELSADKINTLGVVSTSVLSEEYNYDNALDLASPFAYQVPSLFSNHINLMNRYVNMVELFASGTNDVVVINQDESLIMPGYDHYILYEIKDLLGETLTYHYHYTNETIGDTLTSSGLMIINQQNYYIDIKKSNEIDDTEVNYVVYTDISRKSLDYIKMSNELDDYGQYFKYETYQSGELQDILIMKIEINNDEDIELEIELENKISDLHFKLKLKKDANSGSLNGVYEIKDDEDEEQGEIKITVSRNPNSNLNEYRYNYKNEHTKNGFEKGKRNHRQDDDDEDTSFIFTV